MTPEDFLMLPTTRPYPPVVGVRFITPDLKEKQKDVKPGDKIYFLEITAVEEWEDTADPPGQPPALKTHIAMTSEVLEDNWLTKQLRALTKMILKKATYHETRNS